MGKKTCLKCGHEWVSRVENPKTCSKCQSTTWYKTKQMICEIPGCKGNHKCKFLCANHYGLLVRYRAEMEKMPFMDGGYHFFKDRGEFHIHIPDKGQIITRKVIFDLEDKDIVMNYKWCLQSKLRTSVITCVNDWVYKMSHILLSIRNPDTKVYHKNGDLIDNRKANLQEVWES